MNASQVKVNAVLTEIYSGYRKPAFDMTRSLAPPTKPFEVDDDPGVEMGFLARQDANSLLQYNLEYLDSCDDQNQNREVLIRAFHSLHEMGFFVVLHNARQFQVGTFHSFTFCQISREARVRLNYFEPAISPITWYELKKRLAMNFDAARKRAGTELSIVYGSATYNAECYDFTLFHGDKQLLRSVHEAYMPGMAYVGCHTDYLNLHEKGLRTIMDYSYPLFSQTHGVLLHNGYHLIRVEEEHLPNDGQRMVFLYQRGRAVTHIEFTK